MGKNKFSIMGWRVLIKPEEVPEKTKGGIILTAQIKENQERACINGEIVAMGPSAYTFKEDFGDIIPKVGDTILITKYAGNNIIIDGQRYVLIEDKSTLMIVHDKNAVSMEK